jgi:hypothetical protein
MSKKVIKMMELRHARMTIKNLHDKLIEGYACEGDGLVDVINVMMDMLHDIVTTAEKGNVKYNEAKL